MTVYRRRERGQSVVELAMLLPVLMLIVLGCLDLGRVFAVRMALANGAREGARVASLYPHGDPEDPLVGLNELVYTRAREDILAQGLDEGSLGVTVRPLVNLERGNPIEVTAAYTMPLFTTHLFGGRPIVVRAASRMPIVGGRPR